jgi:hypothetical protein
VHYNYHRPTPPPETDHQPADSTPASPTSWPHTPRRRSTGTRQADYFRRDRFRRRRQAPFAIALGGRAIMIFATDLRDDYPIECLAYRTGNRKPASGPSLVTSALVLSPSAVRASGRWCVRRVSRLSMCRLPVRWCTRIR